MAKFLRVYQAEMFRLFRYKIIFFGFFVTAIWIVILGLSDAALAEDLVPTLIVMDSGMMSILLLAASFYFEKQENTIHSVCVSPIPLSVILLAKIASAMTTGIISMLAVAGCAWIIHGVETNLLIMLLYVLFIVAGNTAIGYVFILSSKDFMTLIVKIAGILLLFYVPSLLVPLGLLSEEYSFIALLSPVYAGSRLIESLYQTVPGLEIGLSLAYLALIAVVFYPFVIYKKYQKVALEG